MNDNIPDRGRLVSRKPEQISGPRLSEVQTPSRITVIENLIYSTRGNQPHSVTSRFARTQQTEEQPFKRILTVDEEWVRLDPNWVKVCGMMVISNEEGRRRQRILSKEEKASVNAKIVEVYFAPPEDCPITIRKTQPVGPVDQHTPRDQLPNHEDTTLLVMPYAALLLPPGESQRYTPGDVNRIWLRCQSGTAKIIINLIPG